MISKIGRMIRIDSLTKPIWLGASLVVGLLSTTNARTDEPVPNPVAAFVNGVAISVAEVEFEMARAIGAQQLEASLAKYVRARTLQQLIDRELVSQWLGDKDAAANESEVQLAVDRLKKRLASREITLQEHLEEKRIARAELDRALSWQISWPRFTKRYLTDANLEKYFQDHRVDFDGTTIRVAHILLPIEVEGTETTRAAQIATQKTVAAELRENIVSGEISFAAAASLHSRAPTAATGGDIGFISRHDPMPAAFSDAAYQLAKGDISEPVESRFGIHLIQCLEFKPGDATWEDVREELQVAIKQYLFEWAVKQSRVDSQIEFTDNSPHFLLGTTVLAD